MTNQLVAGAGVNLANLLAKMAYISQSDLIAALGEQTVVDLTDRSSPPSGEIDASVIEAAIADADALIDSYIASKAKLPFAETPALVVKLARDLAAYNLHSHLPEIPEAVRKRRDDALIILRDISAGKANLGSLTNTADSFKQPGGTTTVSGAPGPLSRKALNDYS